MSHLPKSSPRGDLATGLYAAAHWIWGRRGQAKLAGMPFSEETVTETVLLDLTSYLSHVVHVVSFNKREEGRIGADWEWCLHDRARRRYLRFLVQAKVLDDRDSQYAHIDRFIGSSGDRQIDRLAETSRRRGVPALYAFYNNLSDTSRVPSGQCACRNCIPCWGASVARLDAVRDRLPRKGFDDLKDVSIPWACLLCSGGGEGPPPDAIDGALAGMERLDLMSRERCPDAKRDDIPEFRRPYEVEAPAYLKELLNVAEGLDSGPDRRATIERVAKSHADLAGVVLVDSSRPRRRRVTMG